MRSLTATLNIYKRNNKSLLCRDENFTRSTDSLLVLMPHALSHPLRELWLTVLNICLP